MTSQTATPAPVSIEQRYVERMLSGYDYSVEDLKVRATNYLVYKLLRLTESDDAKVSLNAIQQLGMSSVCDLFKPRVEISFDTDTNEQLRDKLNNILMRHAIELTDISSLV